MSEKEEARLNKEKKTLTGQRAGRRFLSYAQIREEVYAAIAAHEPRTGNQLEDISCLRR